MIRLLSLLACATALSAQQTPPPAPTAPDPAPAEQVLSVPEPGRFKNLFLPFRTDNAAVSPDGKYLAYSIRDGDAVSVAVVEIDNPTKMTAHVQVVNDKAATAMLEADQAEKTPGVIRWMRWVSPQRLVVETNQVFSRGSAEADKSWQSWRGAIYGFNADGSEVKLLAKPDDLPEIAEAADTPFTIDRGGLIGNTPDKAPGEVEVAAFFAEAEEPDEEETATPITFASTQGRSLRVFDFDAQRPGAIRIVSVGGARAAGSRGLGFHSLDTKTGKLTDLADETLLTTQSSLIDRQGRIRLTLPETVLSGFPFHYDHLGPKGRNRAKSLDESANATGFTVSPANFFGARSIPLGFDENPDILYYASNVGRDTYGLYSLNLATKERGKLSLENPTYDLIGPPTNGFPGQDTLVFDHFSHQLIGVRYHGSLRTAVWLRPEWQAVQGQLEKALPGRCVDIVDWDQAANRFVISTEGPAEPGAYYVFDRTSGKLLEFVRRAPWVEEQHTHTTLPFSFAAPGGARISGLVTIPRQPRLKPVPMLVLCPDLPWLRVRPDFQSEVQALAGMGFAVVQLNGRGAWGLGLKQRQSLTTGYDLVQVQDIATTVNKLGEVFNVNLKRVALMGRGHGGFIAMRALQAHPEMFRCAVALESPVNLGDWLSEQRWTDGQAHPQLTRAWLGDEARLKAAPLTRSPETLTKPVLLLNYPGPEGASPRSSFAAARSFAASVNRRDGAVTFDRLPTDYMRGLPAARAAVFDRIEEFLNLHVYDFKVKLKDMQIIK